VLIRALLVAAGLFLIGNAAYLALTANLNLGVGLEALLGVAAACFGVFKQLTAHRWLNRLCLAALAVLFVCASLLAGYGMSDDSEYDEDALIVLGAAMHGSQVSPSLARRLDVAVAYHRRNPQALIVVSGGQGAQEDISEAAGMRQYLLDRSVPDDLIAMEDRSTSTAENFAFSKAILDARLDPGYRVAFITNDFHVWRANQLATRAGLDPTHLHAGILWFTVPSAYLREITACGQLLF
jgi:uncharacterized SAM-binding protein YcdF (DUF218 family)